LRSQLERDFAVQVKGFKVLNRKMSKRRQSRSMRTKQEANGLPCWHPSKMRSFSKLVQNEVGLLSSSERHRRTPNQLRWSCIAWRCEITHLIRISQLQHCSKRRSNSWLLVVSKELRSKYLQVGDVVLVILNR
jgi:hypothetical protein